MAGGLLNLVSNGNQSVIIFGNPQKTYWTSTYKRITNFGLQNFRLDFEGLRQLNLNTDSTFVFKVKRYAELLTDMCLVVTLPDIYSPIHPPTCGQGSSAGWAPYEFKWIKNLGAMMIRNIRFTIGGSLIQQMSGYDIVALANRDLNATQKRKWDFMVGNIPEMNDPANAYGRQSKYPNAVYTTATGGAEPSIRGRQLYIPLPIWWGLNSQQAFPLVCLQYNELHIEIQCRPLQELYQIRNIDDPLNNYPYVSPNFNEQRQQFYRFIQTPPNPELVYDNLNTSWKSDVYTSATYCFLSDQEAKVFALNPQKYLVKELSDTWFYKIDTTGKAWLQNSSGLVVSWMMLLQRSDVSTRNEWSNFTNWPYEVLPQNVNLLPLVIDNSPCKEGYSFNFNGVDIVIEPGQLGYGINPDGTETGLFGTGDFRYENQKDILLTLGIMFDGVMREEVRPANMFKYQQQYLHSNGFGATSLDGLYCYNFCLDTSPFQLQPSGVINLSNHSKIELEYTTFTPVLDSNASYIVICDPETGGQIGVNKPRFQLYQYTYNLLVIEERYNVLTFVGGNAAMMNAR